MDGRRGRKNEHAVLKPVPNTFSNIDGAKPMYQAVRKTLVNTKVVFLQLG